MMCPEEGTHLAGAVGTQSSLVVELGGEHNYTVEYCGMVVGHPLGEDVQLPRKLLGSACYSRGKFGSGTGAMLGLFFGGPSSHEASSCGTRF